MFFVDKLRVPWVGGARKVPVTVVYALVVPLLLGVGLLGWIANMFQVITQNHLTEGLRSPLCVALVRIRAI